MELLEQCNLLCTKIKETRQSIIDYVVGILKKHNVNEIYCNYLTNTPQLIKTMTLDSIGLTKDNEIKLWCSDEDENDYVFVDVLDIELLIEFYQWFIDYEDELFTQDY
jgi:hypothetical protein